MPPFAVRRQRLEDLLDRHPDRHVVLVRGPAGGGKTVLVSQWARAQERRCVWLSVGPTHNDPVCLLRDLVEATGALRQVATDRLPGGSTDPGRFDLVDLCEALRAAAQPEGGVATLVLDDVHRVHEQAALDVISHMVEHQSRALRIVLISRCKPRLGLERARLRGDLVEIEPAELRFRRPEINSLTSTWTGRHVDPAEVEQTTLGWAAGLRLAQLEACPGDSPAPALHEPEGVVGQYVTEELIESSSAVLRSFLEVTCWLPMVTEALYAAVTVGADNRSAVAREELEALPIVAVASCPGAFRYPPILARALQKWFSRREQGEATSARCRAAVACRQAGELMTSVRLFLEAGCDDEAADVCRTVAAADESALQAVDALVREYPASMLDSPQWLPWRIRAAVAAGRVDEALVVLEHADRSGLSAVTPGRAGHEDLLVARAVVAEHSGDVTALLACADRVLSPVEGPALDRPGTDDRDGQSAADEDRSVWDRSTMGHAQGWQIRSLVWSGHTDRAREALRTLDQARNKLPVGAQIDLTLARAWLAWVHGDVSRVAELAAAAREGGDSITDGPRTAELALLEGAAHRERNQLAKAVALLHEAHTIASAASHQVIAAAAASELARCRHAAGTSMDALELAVSTRARYPELPYTVDAQLRGAEARLRLRQGDATGAQAAVRDAPAGADRQLLAARIALQRNPTEACELLDAIEARTPRHVVDKLLIRAQLPDLEPQDASTALLQAVSVGGLLGLVRTFLDEGPAVSRRLPELALNVDDRALGRLAALACQELALAPTPGPPDPIEPLTPRELAVLHMLPLRMSNREMAAQMYVSVNTLKTHIRAIYRKLDVSHRSEAVRRAKALQLV